MNLPIITDQNYLSFLHQGRRGYWGMFKGPQQVKTFQDLNIPLIPKNEWDDRINELEKNESTIQDMCNYFNLPCLDQGSTNYCWVNAPTHCCEIIRLLETGQNFSYSPASAGAPIKNFRNVGGWGNEALEYFKKNGLNLTSDWPANQIDRKNYTQENREKALKHKTIEYFVLNSWEERVSCILSGIPIADGYNWWAHEVCGVGLVKGSHDLVIRNSWGMSWGDKGFAILSGTRKMADDSVAIAAMQPR